MTKSVRVKSELPVCVFSRFGAVFENASKSKRELLFIVTPSFSVIRTRGLEPPRHYSLEPETSASTNSATCAFGGVAGGLKHKSGKNASQISEKERKKTEKNKKEVGVEQCSLPKEKRMDIMRGRCPS